MNWLLVVYLSSGQKKEIKVERKKMIEPIIQIRILGVRLQLQLHL
jgi:hypothetical protein